jgi:N utilization substance protein A
METMYSTIQEVPGITEAMADKLAALGMVSVFDVEEVGSEVLMGELEIDQDTADRVVETCSSKAKIVAEQQQKDKEEKERLAKEAAAALADGHTGAAGETAADAILGAGRMEDAPQTGESASGSADDREADILGQ